MSYNYRRFTPASYDLASFEGPRVGEKMPDFSLTTIDGDTLRLSDLWNRRLVLETGSVTCPMYAKGVPAMAEIAARHPDTRFAVLYVREAHPGERTGPHASLDDKTKAARSLADVHHDGRLVVIDDVAGSAHRALGSLPDMVYIVDRDGTVLFRGDWTDPSAVDAVLSGVADDELLGREHFPPARPTPRVAIRTLLTGGFAAILDFVVGLPGLLALHRRADRAYSG